VYYNHCMCKHVHIFSSISCKCYTLACPAHSFLILPLLRLPFMLLL
jgi:hypothetical protein